LITITCQTKPPMRTSTALASGVAAILLALLPTSAGAYVVSPGAQSNAVHLEIYAPEAQIEDFIVSAHVVTHPSWLEGVTCEVSSGRLTEVIVAFGVMPNAIVGTSGQLVVSIEAADAAGRLMDRVQHHLALDVAAQVPDEQRLFEIPECCIWGADAAEQLSGRPARHVLLGNSPNPFAPLTNIRFGLTGTGGNATLRIHDVGGRTIRTISTPALAPGYHQITWNGKDDAGQFVSPGIYFYDLSSGDWSATSKMLLLR